MAQSARQQQPPCRSGALTSRVACQCRRSSWSHPRWNQHDRGRTPPESRQFLRSRVGSIADRNYQTGLPLNGDTQIKARAFNAGEWSALEDETFRILDPLGSIVVSEVMYHPAAPSAAEIAAGFESDEDFEYIEIHNIGSGDIWLDGMRFTKGVDTP